MKPEVDYITGKKGQAVCRPSTWTDIILFFAFNYGLHVFTMLSRPGSSPFSNVTTALLSLLLPFSGVATAVHIIYKRAIRSASSDLQIAHRAGALCMVISCDKLVEPTNYWLVEPGTIVHGQYPCTASGLPSDDNESASPVETLLLRVPESFTVHPPRNSGPTPFVLASNYSVLKGVAGIFQIVGGSFGLYHVSQRQLPRLGYASYSLTVIPYILMSFVNLLASMCEPQYPSMFLVIYRGLEPGSSSSVADVPFVPVVGPESQDDIAAVKVELSTGPADDIAAPKNIPSDGPADDIAAPQNLPPDGPADDIAAPKNLPSDSPAHHVAAPESELSHGPAASFDPLEAHVFGAVGEAYGDLSKLDVWVVPPFNARSILVIVLFVIAVVFCIVTPYILIKLLSGFQPGHSTRNQRGWLMAWLVIGHFYGGLFVPGGLYTFIRSDRLSKPDRPPVPWHPLNDLGLILVLGTAAIGGFVVVGQMIANDQICTII